MITHEDLLKKRIWIANIRENFFAPEPREGKLYHYTSLPVLFSILENDSIWASGTRFSNDSSEEILLNSQEFKRFHYMGDSFITCFSGKEDDLSQWRGYCFNGGVAIEFDIRRPRDYSILHADYETSRQYEIEYNVPFPVLYVDREFLRDVPNLLTKQLLSDSDSGQYTPWEARDIIPYFKDIAFQEEGEWRLMFGNHRGEYAKCVRFRTLRDGVKVPYIVVKAGIVGKNYSKCGFDLHKFTEQKLMELWDNNTREIVIPQGNNQEVIYYKLEAIVNKFNSKLKGNEQPIKIFCEGHLPIRKIIVAPMYDRERVAEKINRYCWNNYWLRNVEVTFSQIPYIPPSE